MEGTPGVCCGAEQGVMSVRAEESDTQISHQSWGQAAFTPSLQHGVETRSKAMFPFFPS